MPGANLKSTISLDKTRFDRGMRSVVTLAERGGRQIGRAFSVIGGNILNVTRRLATMGAALAAIAIPAVLGIELSKVIKSASAFEDLTVRMETFTGSAETAAKILGELAEFGAATPFETRDLQETAGLLAGVGIEADRIVKIVKDLGAVSKSGEQLKELADALGKGFSKQKFQTEELNKFLERGINLRPMLEKVTKQTGPALTKALEKGLAFEDVARAIAMMSEAGGQFNGVLGRLSLTASGLFSTLLSNIQEFRTRFGKPIIDRLKPLLEKAIAISQKLTDQAGDWGAKLVEQMDKFIAFATPKVETLMGLFKEGTVMDAIKTGLEVAGLKLADVLIRAKDAFVSDFKDLPSNFKEAMEAFGQILGGLSKQFDAMMIRGAASFVESFGPGVANVLASILDKIPGMAKSAKSIREIDFSKAAEAARGRADLIDASGNIQVGIGKRALAELQKRRGENALDAFKNSEGVGPALGQAQAKLDEILARAADVGEKTLKNLTTPQTAALNVPFDGAESFGTLAGLGGMNFGSQGLGGAKLKAMEAEAQGLRSGGFDGLAKRMQMQIDLQKKQNEKTDAMLSKLSEALTVN